MYGTLADRLKFAMAGPPKVSQADLARACGVKPPSINDWCSGKTKTLKAATLLKAAAKLKVRPLWLAEGLGPKDLDNAFATTHTVAEPTPQNQMATTPIQSTSRGRARNTLEQVPEHLIGEAMAHMEWLIEREKKIGNSEWGGRAISG